MMKTESKPNQTVIRAKSCGCGCQGSDPWHKRTYSRTVKIGESVFGEDWQGVEVVEQEGSCKLPFSRSAVRVTREARRHADGTWTRFGSWVIDFNSVAWD